MTTPPPPRQGRHMTAAAITRYGGPEAIELLNIPLPEPGPHEALVAVVATTINPVDVKFRTPGTQQQVNHFPKVLGWDVAGIVIRAPHTSRWQPGDRVIAMRPPSDDGYGCWAPYATVPTAHLVPAPTTVDLSTAAVLPLAGLTAAQALNALDPTPTRQILVTGAAGSVGGFAVQLAHARGWDVTALVSRPEHVDAAIALGANRARDDATDLEGFDAILDTAGVLDHPHLLAPGGHLVTVSDDPLPTWAAARGATAHRNYVTHDPACLTQLAQMVDAGDLTLRVNATRPLHDIAEAHRHAERSGRLGKTVLLL